jgi:hypothetical protein
MQATAKTVEGETSSWPASIDLRRLSAVSLTPSRMSAKRSVLAVHWTITLSRLLSALKFLNIALEDQVDNSTNILDLLNILADLLNMGVGRFGTWDEVVGTLLLVGSNEVRVVDGGKGLHVGQLLADERLESRLEDTGTIHGLSQVHAADVPSTDHEVIRMDHGEKIMEGDVDILAARAVGAEFGSRSHDDRAIVVSRLSTRLGVPSEATLVGDDTGSNSGSVVTTPSNQHDADLGDLTIDLEVIQSFLGNRHILTLAVLGDGRGAVRVLGVYKVVRVLDVGGVDNEEILGGSRSSSYLYTNIRRADDSVFSVGSHIG